MCCCIELDEDLFITVAYFYECGDLIFVFHKRSFDKLSSYKLMKDDLVPWNYLISHH